MVTQADKVNQREEGKNDGQMMTRTEQSHRQPMKAFLAENRPEASQLNVYQLTSDTREETACLFYILSQHSLQTQRSIPFSLFSTIMKLTAFITDANSGLAAKNATLHPLRHIRE